jgi:uncharacterized protein YprB with RNaseH-like and TPR domain
MGEDLRSRLRRLRREPVADDPSSAAAAAQVRSAHEQSQEQSHEHEHEHEPEEGPARALGGAGHGGPPRAEESDSVPAIRLPAASAPASVRSAYERLKRRADGRPASMADEPRVVERESSKIDRVALAPVPSREEPRPRGELSWGPPARLDASGATQARTTLLARGHPHGTVPLERFLELDAAHLAALAKDERIATCDLSRAVFLDTETSGLSGGAGTYVWLVGLGRFLDGPEGCFESWQGFLAHPAKERELLAEASARIAAASCLVTFFGKSFDRHRLEDKMRLHGVEPPFARVPHLDLYWPLRRAHRGKWADCRLKTLERELCGVQRVDDLPGSFAPAAWFDFLASRPHRLEGVFRHNFDDVLSLVALATRA